jgi:hypothetical protein
MTEFIMVLLSPTLNYQDSTTVFFQVVSNSLFTVVLPFVVAESETFNKIKIIHKKVKQSQRLTLSLFNLPGSLDEDHLGLKS